MFSEGARMAVLHEAEMPKALAVYRIHHTTFSGRRFYVDDLVTLEHERGNGYGAALLQWCEEAARTQGCESFGLDSGVQRAAAHRFYFRQGMAITAFSFAKPLS
jgi:GNAT superfamily N-acetyltransferase